MAQDVEQAEVTKSTLEGLRESFPFTTIRPAQDQALQVHGEAHDEGTKFSIFELPTGSGKSPLGMACGRWSANNEKEGPGPGAHYLTSQNSLSQQLLNDFSHLGLTQIRGKGNYRCQEFGTDCNNGSILNGGKTCPGCPYRVAKNAYTNSKLGVTNYTYYLTERMYVRELEPRNYLILDEAHNIEREILSMVDIQLTQRRLDMVGAGRLPYFEPGEDERVRDWLAANFLPLLNKAVAKLSAEVEAAHTMGERGATAVRDQKTLQGMQQLASNMAQYIEASERGDWLAWSDSASGNLCIRPLTAAGFAQDYLFDGTPNVLMMSGTILDFDTFRRNLGIRKSQARTLAIPSEFPQRTRRIVYWPVGGMGSKNIANSLPRLAERITALLSKFSDKKGIIHSHSYKINGFLGDALGKGDHRNRILTHSQLKGQREVAIERHFKSPEPTVLLSPSMTEGLDLKDDLGRFNLIAKVPYPTLDPYNVARMERDPKWYQLQTALTLVQASGRCNRSEDDNALTVILDSDFGRFLSQNQDILPKWWMDSIEFKG